MILGSFLLGNPNVETSLNLPAGSFSLDGVNKKAIQVNEVTIGKCVADKLYITQDTDVFVPNWQESSAPTINDWKGDIPDTWEWETALNANFNGNLLGGSVEFSTDAVSEIRLKRRKSGDKVWKTIYSHEVDDASDFQFDYYDWLATGNTKYQYALVPVISGEEGAITSQEVESKFSDFYVIGIDDDGAYVVYHVVANSADTFQYNIEGSAQTTISRKYPFITQNGCVGYYSGTLEGTFVQFVNCELDLYNGAKYRKKADSFLGDGKEKILKDWMGNIFLMSIHDVISQSNNDYVYTPVHSINWTECGDAEDVGELYDNGFINTDIDRE